MQDNIVLKSLADAGFRDIAKLDLRTSNAEINEKVPDLELCDPGKMRVAVAAQDEIAGFFRTGGVDQRRPKGEVPSGTAFKHDLPNSKPRNLEYCQRPRIRPIREANMLYFDPVCGKRINRNKAHIEVEYEGNHYLLCCPKCQAEFERDPRKYAVNQKTDRRTGRRK